jgi:hypothetical protein
MCPDTKMNPINSLIFVNLVSGSIFGTINLVPINKIITHADWLTEWGTLKSVGMLDAWENEEPGSALSRVEN